ncbi:EAL domain-containing protein (putative c-di-GMP-specific phosphodiesterase class I) [Pseudomonas duriflava]|uniref:EAL domain-containing protein (Putative c-di-GMP-specific phosphodiesterase class I) n=1 Tax=Pseudomonas duriflava TaxID=459528 RepID=A0A562Q4M8_9PSED|nr:GGDEF and EAL domain-containing protein [Pseudomonas duriflava]TWI50976.1 EAL domain-containing protein (putative c-di-GMP-specific phosphodiesterase class I) [Pseudomonas duriflava]
MSNGAALPHNEIERLVALRSTNLLDSPADPAFDHIAEIASELFDVPIAVISLVDKNRQWFKSIHGLDAQETPREYSFCAHAILKEDVLQVKDALLDPRFKDNPLVTGEPGIRFYAGVPLVTHEGLALGTLCLVDTHPRAELDSSQLRLLTKLRDMLMERIEALRSLSYVDPITRLPNRSRLLEDAEAMRREANELVAVSVDVFDPGYLNDLLNALGQDHYEGLIRTIQARLQTLLPDGTRLYCIGATRFAFLVQNQSPATCKGLLKKVELGLTGLIEYNGIPIETRPGLGIINLNSEDETLDWLRALICTADVAREMRTGSRYYDSVHDRAQQRAFALLSSLPVALHSEGQLSLFFQPRVDLKTGICRCVESLLRWAHPKLGAIGPTEFIPLAEKTALIRSISYWVIDAVLEQYARWKAAGHTFSVSINISSHDLDDPHFAERVAEKLALHRVPPSCVEFEVTENSLMCNFDNARAQLDALRHLGASIAIDDFGTGYNNLIYLRQIPTDVIKIDQSFIRGLPGDDKDALIVRSMVDLAHALGYQVTAEGVETSNVLEAVLELGCDEGQGYHIALPMAANELETWLEHADRHPRLGYGNSPSSFVTN